MKVLVDFTIVPVGTGVSVSAYVAECERVLADAGLEYRLHANGTDIEGEWEAVFAALRHCHERVHEMGAPRLFSSVKVNTRTDRDQGLDDKLASVERQLRT